MRSAIQFLTRTAHLRLRGCPGDPRHRPDGSNVWANAIHRVAADGISPEQAVDEAIARIKQILAE